MSALPLAFLDKISQSARYWLLHGFIAISFLATALYYQYVLETLPCVLCIQIRFLVSMLLFASLAGFFLRKNRWGRVFTNLSVLVVAVSLSERSYQLLGTERGFVFGDCGFNPGFPDWFAIDSWLPWLFRVETSCGYTPELLFGITMAEALMVFSVMLLLSSTLILLASVFSRVKKTI